MKNRVSVSKRAVAPVASPAPGEDFTGTPDGEAADSLYALTQRCFDAQCAILAEMRMLNWLMAQMLAPQSVDIEELRSSLN